MIARCGQKWIDRGNCVSKVFSANRQVIEWCDSHGIACEGFKHLNPTSLPDDFDYLFSIANLNILPRSITGRANKDAINYHDGPLPEYIGVNTPAWAILNGESTHAVSFHLMERSVDSGKVLVRRNFEITDDETSFTLNAKCHSEAEEAFADLLDVLNGTAPASYGVSTAAGRRYTKNQKPCPVLNWSKTGHELCRLINALHFGPSYDNPLCTPMIFTGQSYVSVDSVTVEPDDLSHAPGRITRVEGDIITVACADCYLTLSTRASAFIADSSLPLISAEAVSSIEKDLSAVGVDENYWRDRLLDLKNISLPYCTRGGGSGDKFSYEQALTHRCSRSVCLSVLLAYLGRIAGQQSFDIALACERRPEYSNPELISVFKPLRVDFDNTDSADEFAARLQGRLEEVTARSAITADLTRRVAACNADQAISSIGIALQPVSDEVFTGDLLIEIAEDGTTLRWICDKEVLTSQSVVQMQEQLQCCFEQVSEHPGTALGDLALLSSAELERLSLWNDTALAIDAVPVHQAIEQSVAANPDSIALVYGQKSVTYTQLNSAANQAALFLQQKGIKNGDLVGVLMDRTIDMMVALLAVLKCGAAYVPLDPVYPIDRLEYMAKDANLALIVSEPHYRNFLNTDQTVVLLPSADGAQIPDLSLECSPNSLAYVIYTSGSTGRPKGVMVEHGNVANFFAAMDQRIPGPAGTWLAVTSISFDISVLELFWTLARGYKVVLYTDDRRQRVTKSVQSTLPNKHMDMSLFYWNVATEESIAQDAGANNKYRLLLEGAKFADENGFAAVWNPERHFSAFGGSFPNPAVTCAAIAATTSRVAIRAGSCVAPLHSAIRIAEDWSVIDNLSNGRAGVAFAAGWAAPDFAILPENFTNAKEKMFEQLGVVQRLWRGESVDFPGPKGDVSVRTLPRPVQRELPVWITTAGNPANFQQAGEVGANLLTHLLGQTLEELSEKIKIYRKARAESGHEGAGTVTVMLHTCVGESKDAVKSVVEQPMKQYLKSAMFLVKDAAWSFPTFKKMSKETGATLDSFFENITDTDMEALLDFAFQRYFNTSGLFGSVQDAVATVDQCKGIGINEIACLIDFGMDDDTVLDHLPYLADVRSHASQRIDDAADEEDCSIADLIKHHNVSHLQCTPSMAGMLMADADSSAAVATLTHMMVGGEALPLDLATQLADGVSGAVTNMYGPTETTIWSTTAEIKAPVDRVDIGTPIANTQVYIVDSKLRLQPPNVPGELLIGGAGVVRGYLNRPDLTADKFVKNPFDPTGESRLYRTGDLACYLDDGAIRYLGRMDNQVKIHGYRVELGEIESALCDIAALDQAVVIMRDDSPGGKKLVAYLVSSTGFDLTDMQLREHLLRSLPSFMVPAVFMQLKTLPLTPNGKIDRNSLPAPKIKSSAPKSVPGNKTEETIAEHWKAALGMDEVGTRDNFFDIGGHSILVIDVLKRLNNDDNIGKQLSMVDLFRHTTIESLATHLNEKTVTLSMKMKGGDRAAARKAARTRRRTRTKETVVSTEK